MTAIKEKYLEWALKHLQKYSHSDFYPRLFEYAALVHNWAEVKKHILSIDLDDYSPKSPLIDLAPKSNGNYRVVHQLDPIDSLIYTSLVREVCDIIENYRIPELRHIACSYRIKPNEEGSFFPSDSGWDEFNARTEELADEYEDGYVIVADITDFYNQIYTHRIRNLIEEAGKGAYHARAKVIEKFLISLNKETSRGIPVGPAPSIILAELIMASIDNKILTYTDDFVRYVDDIRIFFKKREDAILVQYELTQYLYSYHRLVFSGEKTRIRRVSTFRGSMRNEEREENAVILSKAGALASEKVEELLKSLPDYESGFDYQEEYETILAQIMDDEQFKLLSSTYLELFQKSISFPVDFGLLRHILRKASKYRVRNLIPFVLANFEKMLPLIRETIIYLNVVINDKIVVNYRKEFESIISAHYMRLSFVNMWVSHLLTNESFNKINLPSNYNQIIAMRDRALIALRKSDTTWVRDFRDKVDTLGPWEKRAVLYSSKILSSDEMKVWIRTSVTSGEITEKSLASFLVSQNHPKKLST